MPLKAVFFLPQKPCNFKISCKAKKMNFTTAKAEKTNRKKGKKEKDQKFDVKFDISKKTKNPAPDNYKKVNS